MSSSFSFSTSSGHSIYSSISSVRQFSLNEIKQATDNFDMKNLIGRGGECDVYLGKFYYGESKSEKVFAAVKHFHADIDEGLEKEVQIATEMQHPNIISLLGYCLESGERVLVYEYAKRGSLYDYVKKRSTISLSWKQRLEICVGAAYGLQYLHKGKGEFGKGIIHRDVKPSNILLDENWVAKVSGFEISRLVQTDHSVATMIKGTGGYYAPEYVMNGKVTNKIDVYGFGVVLFQVLCCKMPWDREGDSYYPHEDEDLGVWAQENIDTKIADGISDDSLKAFTNAIGRCLQQDPKKRPTMDQVVLLLETAIKCQKGESEPVLNIDPIPPRKAEVTTSASSSSELHILLSSSSCPQFSLAAIEEATDNFRSLVLGKGGEAWVYKAQIYLNSEKVRTPVAVKKFKTKSPEFAKEIVTVTKIRHPHIVSLLGYCYESDQQILIYEYMGKGSLAAYVKKNSALRLTWEQRLKICLDVAYGLHHLHEQTDECKKGMIHRDVKPANILLDDNLVAKVSDFGLLKLSLSENDTSVISNNNSTGTAGYLAPEYAYFRRLSTKFDVYSFGMVMFEVLCRQKKWEVDDDQSNYSYMEDTEDIALLAQENVDKQINDSISFNCLKIFTSTIADCLRKDPKKRPTMAGVIRLLESALKFQEDESEQILNDHLKDVRISEFDIFELESPFSIGNELEKVQQEHELRAEYFGSMFSDIETPLPDFHTAIFSWNASTLKIDDLKDVIRSCPTEDEMEKLKNYNGDKEMLGKREQFFLELAKVPRLESKLGVFCFSMTLSHQVNDLRQSMETVNVATIEVKGSRKMRQVIQIIGALWNSQNQGTVPGFDQRFRLGSLLELSNTRSKSSKMTMMHFLCKHLTEKKAELLDFDKDLIHLEAAAELQIQYLAEKIQALREGLQMVEREVTASDNDGFISASFQKAMRSFLDTAEDEVKSLGSLYSEMKRNLDTLVQYFGEDPAQYSFELVATTLLKFTKLFIKENQPMADLENKKVYKADP